MVKGYNQVPGIDFQDFFAPVVSDVTFRILLILKMLNKWNGINVDVETAFQNGELEEELYIGRPDGWEEFCTKNNYKWDYEFFPLLKANNGLV